MRPDIFSGLPAYVRITILSQIRRLLSTPLFYNEDREDILQDLLLFYLKRFYTIPDPDEALVVHAIKQYATTLLKQRYLRKDFLNSSLADFADEEFSFCIYESPDNEKRMFMADISKYANEKENQLITRIIEGDSIDKISKEIHMSKKTIYQFFEKLRKKLK